jgi:hypothetical protein
MVTVTTTLTQSQKARANLERVKKMATRPGVRVEPRDADMRRLLKHPRAGGFRSEGSIEWPDDTFTRRRLKEGSVKLAEKKEAKPHPEPPEPRRARTHES